MRTAAVILVAATALVAAGCGGGGKKAATPLELVSQAVSKTTTGNSAKFHMDITEKANGIGPFTFTADGVSDASNRSARMSLDMSSIAQILSGGKKANGNDWKADVILDGTDAKNIVEYLRLPVLTKQLPSGKSWVKIELNKLDQLNNVNLTTLLQAAGQQDPTQALQLLQSVGDVKAVGSEQVGGVDTTHYTGTIDPKTVADKYGLTGLAPVLAASGAQSMPIDVWIDGDGYVRKFQESVKGTNATLDIATTLSDFGATVDLTPPPAGDTTDLSAALKK
ncbi:MAG: LppX_LprAFG lipoprotein [Actinomycetota bacterium]